MKKNSNGILFYIALFFFVIISYVTYNKGMTIPRFIVLFILTPFLKKFQVLGYLIILILIWINFQKNDKMKTFLKILCDIFGFDYADDTKSTCKKDERKEESDSGFDIIDYLISILF
ncbi:hypothetical protein TCON_2476 [Astathelohania contejeani]|uniref:Uncharacterized protein n=1 Tax=Astathelohania contejeani TaxID=164912 RepID=A0ABQ7HVX7_9MICR|nr:hypothetical protein TCON_2476 [Thelohania contejeani]